MAVPVLRVPGGDRLGDQMPEVGGAVGAAKIERQPVGLLLGELLDGGQGRRYGHAGASTAPTQWRTRLRGRPRASRRQASTPRS